MTSDRRSAEIKRLVEQAQKNRVNRLYYKQYFNCPNIRRNGLLQDPEKASYDQVVLSRDTNESFELVGFDQTGSHFSLSISIIRLPNVDSNLPLEDWRLARVCLIYDNGEYKYSYSAEQLVDYAEKIKNAETKPDALNLYTIGSLTLEIVQPFTFSRIQLRGKLDRTSHKQLTDQQPEQVFAHLTISTHPIADKFDYKYYFNTKFVRNLLDYESLTSPQENWSDLLDIVLDDRIDQPLMFQGQLQLLTQQACEDFVMWGSKSKHFYAIERPKKYQQRENLIIWAECGHQIHLFRCQDRPGIISGLVSSNFDYCSCLYSVKLYLSMADKKETSNFKTLNSFYSLTAGCRLSLIGYESKVYNIELEEAPIKNGAFKVQVNGFRGWAVFSESRPDDDRLSVESNLWTMSIHADKSWRQLANESLLGGKGNSLVELAELVACGRLTQAHSKVSVPRGLVVTCLAYKIWLESNAAIKAAIEELDHKRKSLAAKTVYLNPLSDRHLTLAQSQQILKTACEKACTLLKSCRLPKQLQDHLSKRLATVFSGETKDGLFAVRSSARGEDSLETSAAGQMKTMLNVVGSSEDIGRAIIDCWASQFEWEAVAYKSQNGLELNLPMAVVVQEMVPCKSAGVGATCDPLDGNREQLQILANAGLGEGVVSGKATDTIRVSLNSLEWEAANEEYVGYLDTRSMEKCSEKLLSNGAEGCCLTNHQVGALANLLLDLRRCSQVRDREIEWGITIDGSSSCSSSSTSSSSADGAHSLSIHLLQSRPLTHLARLSSREIEHELDYGFSTPLDMVSRANLGEVMPGAMCTLTSNFFFGQVQTGVREKPFRTWHTQKSTAANSFAFHGQVMTLVLSYSDSIKRLYMVPDPRQPRDPESTEILRRVMIGIDIKDDEKVRRFCAEKVNPESFVQPHGLGYVLAMDLGGFYLAMRNARRIAKRTLLEDDLTPLETYMDGPSSAGRVLNDIELLYGRLCGNSKPLQDAWQNHVIVTILSMALNVICMKSMAGQPAYPNDMNDSEILNDFSTLMRGGERTESADISSFLDDLVSTLKDEGQLERAQKMELRELYEFLRQPGASRCSRLYGQFIAKNGHRGYKEFDFSTHTWADDPSYVIKALAARLKRPADAKTADAGLADRLESDLAPIMAKISRNRGFLTGYLLPRARNAVVRREQSKSYLIKVIDKYRRAFRHLGGLLCLAGRLPSAELIFHLALEELDMVVMQRGHLSRLIYKARRRQQRMRVLNQVRFPEPTLIFSEMIQLVRETCSENPASATTAPTESDGDPNSVRGVTSCAGCVTGRACVVNSPDDMDQIEPNDILITYSIDTSWSVYFFALAGIVTEVGGVVSHGAVVAREYGIPTLCTALGACSKFRTGQHVTLDASSGVCYLAEQGGDK